MTTQKCFTITVDGKKYGPFLWQYREHEKIKSIERLAGISLSTPIYRAKWKPFAPPGPPRAKRDRSTPLLDGVGFVPASKDATVLGW